MVVAQEKRQGSQGGHQIHVQSAAAVRVQPDQSNRRDVQEDLGIGVQPRVGHNRQQGRRRRQASAIRGKLRGEMKHKHRAERDQRDGQDRLAEQVVAKRELKRARQVVLEKEPGVEEVPDRHIAQQDLPRTRQVREMIVREVNGEPAEEKDAGENPEIQKAEGNPPESKGSGTPVVSAGVHSLGMLSHGIVHRQARAGLRATANNDTPNGRSVNRSN